MAPLCRCAGNQINICASTVKKIMTSTYGMMCIQKLTNPFICFKKGTYKCILDMLIRGHCVEHVAVANHLPKPIVSFMKLNIGSLLSLICFVQNDSQSINFPAATALSDIPDLERIKAWLSSLDGEKARHSLKAVAQAGMQGVHWLGGQKNWMLELNKNTRFPSHFATHLATS